MPQHAKNPIILRRKNDFMAKIRTWRNVKVMNASLAAHLSSKNTLRITDCFIKMLWGKNAFVSLGNNGIFLEIVLGTDKRAFFQNAICSDICRVAFASSCPQCHG